MTVPLLRKTVNVIAKITQYNYITALVLKYLKNYILKDGLGMKMCRGNQNQSDFINSDGLI